MTKATAKKWCIKKWEWIVASYDKPNRPNEDRCTEDDVVEAIPELKEFEAGCAYCEKYHVGHCGGCPLVKLTGKTCGDSGSLYYNWHDKKTAQAMLDAIKKS